jgi:hypothetical protein
MFVQMCIAKILKATQRGMTFMVAAQLDQQDILLRDNMLVETPCTEAILDSMHTVHEQMVNSDIVFHYYNTLDKSIGDIPLHEDNQLTYFMHPTITRIKHFQNEDEAWNMTRFIKRELHRLLVLLTCQC